MKRMTGKSVMMAALGVGLFAASAQAALVPVFEYQFPGSYNGTVSAVTDLSGAGNHATAIGHPLALSSNVPVGAPAGAQSLNLAAQVGNIRTTNIDLITSTNVQAAGGLTYDFWFNPTGNNSIGANGNKIIDNAGTEYVAYLDNGTTTRLRTNIGPIDGQQQPGPQRLEPRHRRVQHARQRHVRHQRHRHPLRHPQ